MTAESTLASFPDSAKALIQGASRGIGFELTRQLLTSTKVDTVFATCRNPDTAADLQDLARLHGERLQVLALDVSSEASVVSAASVVVGRIASLDLLVNCAGVLHEPSGMRPERRLADVEVNAFIHSMYVNALGPLLVAKHFEPLFRLPKRAIYASISARVGSIGDNRLGGWYAYRASKAAQNMNTRNLSIELRRRARGIVCVALHPGTVDTALSQPFQGKLPKHKLFTVTEAASKLLSVIDLLNTESNGRFYAWDGTEIPW